ncbi:BGTF surface domain-containing protein [Halorubrum sp. Ea1]|uniref:BGTF surface domain-containing protein n=1 Tax=Halorubrum sp. Ea1 TaxID=1480718 RepID=UPI0020CF8A29|nr:BGTF surface domain-containing protein [Halorubrum sp. Ea1]
MLFSLLGAAATGPAAATIGKEKISSTSETTPTDGTASASGNEVVPAITTESVAGSDDITRQEIDGTFSRPTYTGTAGDPVEIRHIVDASENDSAYLLVGGNRLTDSGGTVSFVDVLKVSGDSTTINTRLMGTRESNVDSCSAADVSCDLEFRDENGDVVAEDLSELRTEIPSATGAGGLARPLVPERYRIAITGGTFIIRDSGAVDPVEVAAESDLVLQQPELHDEIEVFTTPNADMINNDEEGESVSVLRKNGLNRTTVTKGDRIVLGFESTGIWGALSYFAKQKTNESIEAGTSVDHSILADLLKAEEGVSLRVHQTNLSGNEHRSELDLAAADAEDITLFFAERQHIESEGSSQPPSRFYLAIDTSDSGPFTDVPDPGDEFSVEFSLEGTEGDRYAFHDSGGQPPAAFKPVSATTDEVSEQYPYYENINGQVSVEASFSIQERYVKYDHVDDDRTLLVEADNGTITGTTSILPTPELSAIIVQDKNETQFRTESELTYNNSNFSVDSELSNATPGTKASYRLYQGQMLQDTRPILIVKNASNPDRLRLANATTNLTVTRGESLANLTTEVENVGQLRNRERLRIDVDDGEIVGERYVTVAPQAETNETFGGLDADLEPGEYPYSLAIDGDVVNGTLTVEADPAVTRVDDDRGSGDGTRESVGEDGSGDAAGDDSDDGDDGDGSDPSRNDSTGEGSGGGTADGTDGAGGAPDEGSDEGPATLLPFGIGTRETFGGTVLVGATYLLGHWV